MKAIWPPRGKSRADAVLKFQVQFTRLGRYSGLGLIAPVSEDAPQLHLFNFIKIAGDRATAGTIVLLIRSLRVLSSQGYKPSSGAASRYEQKQR
jgi:hypothetical protein